MTFWVLTQCTNLVPGSSWQNYDLGWSMHSIKFLLALFNRIGGWRPRLISESPIGTIQLWFSFPSSDFLHFQVVGQEGLVCFF